MALYFVKVGDAVLVVREANGRAAMEAVNGSSCARILESGPPGVVGFDGESMSAPARMPEEDDAREVDVTSLSDVGVRRFRNLDTGEERTEPR